MAAIAFVLHTVGLKEIGALLWKVRPGWLLAALVAFVLSKWVAAERLNRHFARRGLVLSPTLNLRLYLAGMFYNLFLPGGIGGDGFKLLWLNRRYPTGFRTLGGAMLWDRLSGITVLVFISILGIWALSSPGAQMTLLLPVLAALTFPAYYLAQRMIVRDLSGVFFPVTAISFLSQGLILLCVWLLILSLGVAWADHGAYLIIFLVAAIIANIPISLGGLGPREMVSLMGANRLELLPDTAVALSLLFYFLTLLVSFIGIFFAVNPEPADEAAEQKR